MTSSNGGYSVDMLVFSGVYIFRKLPHPIHQKTLPQAPSYLILSPFFLGRGLSAYACQTENWTCGKIPLTFFDKKVLCFGKLRKKKTISIQDLVSSLNSTCFHLKTGSFSEHPIIFLVFIANLIIFFTEKTVRRKDLEIGSSGEGGNHFVPIGPQV